MHTKFPLLSAQNGCYQPSDTYFFVCSHGIVVAQKEFKNTQRDGQTRDFDILGPNSLHKLSNANEEHIQSS